MRTVHVDLSHMYRCADLSSSTCCQNLDSHSEGDALCREEGKAGWSSFAAMEGGLKFAYLRLALGSLLNPRLAGGAKLSVARHLRVEKSSRDEVDTRVELPDELFVEDILCRIAGGLRVDTRLLGVAVRVREGQPFGVDASQPQAEADRLQWEKWHAAQKSPREMAPARVELTDAAAASLASTAGKQEYR